MESMDKVESLVREAIPTAKDLAEHVVNYTQIQAKVEMILSVIGFIIFVPLMYFSIKSMFAPKYNSLQDDFFPGKLLVSGLSFIFIMLSIVAFSENYFIYQEPVGYIIHKYLESR